jgi:hypothetical protein
MSDLMAWGLFAVFLAVLTWAFWPKISRLLRITANEGDEIVAGIEAARKEVKRDIKSLKRKIKK